MTTHTWSEHPTYIQGRAENWGARYFYEAFSTIVASPRFGSDPPTPTIYQGGYNRGGVSKSAGTHDGGDVFDLSAYNWKNRLKVWAMLGGYGWHRPYNWDGRKGGPHMHLGIRGGPTRAGLLRTQETNYDNRRNGLVSNRYDADFRLPGGAKPLFVFPEDARGKPGSYYVQRETTGFEYPSSAAKTLTTLKKGSKFTVVAVVRVGSTYYAINPDGVCANLGSKGVDGTAVLSKTKPGSTTTTPVPPTQPPATLGQLSTIKDGRINELSGLATSVKWENVAYGIIDEDAPVWVIQPSSGKIIGSFSTGITFKDSEAIAINPASGRIGIADIGDNNAKRKTIEFTILPEPGPGHHGRLPVEHYVVRYADGKGHNAETLLIDRTGQYWIVTKESTGRLWKVDLFRGVATMVKGVALPKNVTDGDLFHNDELAVLRAKDVRNTLVFETKRWTKVGEISTPVLKQGEAVAVEMGEKTFLVGSEGSNSPLYRVAIPDKWTPATPEPPAQGSKIDLTNWKITLPDGSEVTQPRLATFEDSPWFVRNASSLTFRANCGGGTTPNSSYPRSELREMSSGGSKRAAWTSTLGKHVMTADIIFDHLPVKKPHVVGLQIHDSEDDVCMLRLEGTKLFIESPYADDMVLDHNYVLGTRVIVQIQVASGKVIIRYWRGETKRVRSFSRRGSGWYFKAGCYTQSNVSKGDLASAYGQVRLLQLAVSHA